VKIVVGLAHQKKPVMRFTEVGETKLLGFALNVKVLGNFEGLIARNRQIEQ